MADHPPLPSPSSALSAADEVPKTSQARRLALAFQGVFGQDGRNARTSDQRLVLAHLRTIGCADRPVFQADRAGTFDPLAAAHRDGARAMILIIDRQLAHARRDSDQDKPKPKVKR